MERDKEVYEYMLFYQGLHGAPPKLDEIKENIDGLNYRSSVRQALVRLERQGLVEHSNPNTMRCWRAVE